MKNSARNFSRKAGKNDNPRGKLYHAFAKWISCIVSEKSWNTKEDYLVHDKCIAQTLVGKKAHLNIR